MLTTEQAKDRAHDLVKRAMAAGADAADAVYSGNASRDVQVRLGALEDVGSAEGEDIGLRVFVGKQSASVSSSDLSTRALDALAERAVAMARQAPEDAYAGLAPEDRLFKGIVPNLDLSDTAEPSPTEMRERAMIAEDAARAVQGVTNSEGASASMGQAVVALATSHGFAGGYGGTSHGVSASVLAGEGSGMERDYAYHVTRYLNDLDDAAAIGKEAGDRAVARLSPARLKSGPMPILFDPRVSSSLIGHLLGAISGSSIARKTSFLIDQLGEAIFSSNVTVLDDPLRIRGLRSRPFDGEGLEAKPTTIIDAGVLTGWMMDSASARQLNLEPTGHASRGVSGPPGVSSSNLHMAAGAATPAELMADIKTGFYVTELIGMGVNGLTGDYSRGASGFLIDNGQIAGAVSEVTIAGNLKDMFKALIPANDLTFRQGSNAPTVRVDGMMVAGE
jgi:PmbA protein